MDHRLPLTLQTTTRTRGNLIRFCAGLAEGFDPGFFHDPKRPVLIGVTGTTACGKSLVVETMMRAWDDADNPSPTSPEKHHMYLERAPCAAVHTVTGQFNVAGRQTFHMFSSAGMTGFMDLLRQDFRIATRNALGGSIFLSGRSTGYDPDIWMRINLHSHTNPSHLTPYDWTREISVTVENPDLKASPRFQENWERLVEDHAPRKQARAYPAQRPY